MSGSLLNVLAPIAGAGLGSSVLPGLAGDIGISGLSPALGGLIGGAAGGGATSGLSGAALGGLGGYLGGPALDKGISGVGDFFSGGGGGSGAGGVISGGAGADVLAGNEGGDLLQSATPAPTGSPFAGAGGGTSAAGFGGAIGDVGTGVDPTLANEVGSGAALAPAAQLDTPNVTPMAGVAQPGTLNATVPSLTNPTAAAPAGGGLNLGGKGGVLGQLLPAGLLAAALARGSQQQPAVGQIQGQANSDIASANQLSGAVTPAVIDAITKGTVPAAVQKSIDAQVASSQAAIRSKYAQMGLTGSTAEQQELSAAKQQGVTLAYQQAQQLAQTGLSAISQASGESGQADTLLNSILTAQTAQSTELGNALSQYAAAMARAA